MTTQTFETSKGTLLVIRLPEGATNPKLIGDFIVYFLNGERRHEYVGGLGLKGEWKEIGLWGSVPEEKAKEVVDNESVGLYVDYTAASDFGKKRRFSTALESLQSLLETQIKLSNDLGHRPIYKPLNHGTSTGAYNRFENDLAEWQAAEAEVWKHFYLTFKKK